MTFNLLTFLQAAIKACTVVTGRRQNDYIVFNATRVIEHSSTMTMLTDWSVAGQLTKVGGHWVYSGVVASSQPGFFKLMMSPTTAAASTVRQYSASFTSLLYLFQSSRSLRLNS